MSLLPGEAAGNAAAFDYEEFAEWYSAQCTRTFEPAAASFNNLLTALLERELDDFSRDRTRLSSRVKAPARLWSKLNSDEYAGKATRFDDIPSVIDDIVGLRITCNNNSDLARIRELIATLPYTEDDENASLATDPAEEKLYYEEPKKSGYRAYHVNLVTLVAHPGAWVRVVGELQVRTLLQDSWGELTHEDTYKASVGLPPLAETIARRMADILATVDDLAQDLRNELERAATQSVVDDVVDAADGTVTDIDLASHSDLLHVPLEPLQEALIEETRRVVSDLTKQATLAQVSQLVQGSFGRGISEGWGGFGSFGSLLRAAVPQATVITEPPGYVIPPGVAPGGVAGLDEIARSIPDPIPGVPMVIRRLRLLDKSMPEVDAGAIQELISAIENALSADSLNSLGLDLRNPGLRDTNALSKRLRDEVLQHSAPFVRSQIDYFLKALLFSGNLRPNISSEDISEILARWFYARARMLGAIQDATEDADEVRRWMGLDEY